LLVPKGLPDSELTVKDLQSHPFAVDFPSGSNLRLHLRSGEFKIVGHSDIAPGRKTDPGASFDWPRFRALLSERLAAGPGSSRG